MSIDLSTLTFNINRTIQYVAFCAWLLLLSMFSCLKFKVLVVGECSCVSGKQTHSHPSTFPVQQGMGGYHLEQTVKLELLRGFWPLCVDFEYMQ